MKLLLATVVTLGAIALVPATASAGDLDCGDFGTQAEAQAHLFPGDPHRLDADDDGIACDSLPCPCSSVRPGNPDPEPIDPLPVDPVPVEPVPGDRSLPLVACLTTWAQDGSAALDRRYEPRRCDMHSDDGHRPIVRFSVLPTARLSWSYWGASGAKARGRVHVSSVGFMRATVWLSRAKLRCGSWTYSRARVKIDRVGRAGRSVKIATCR